MQACKSAIDSVSILLHETKFQEVLREVFLFSASGRFDLNVFAGSWSYPGLYKTMPDRAKNQQEQGESLTLLRP